MKKAMLSQPMAGKSDEEIVTTREKAIKVLKEKGYEVVNTLFTDEWYTLSNICSEDWMIADETNCPVLGGEATFGFGDAIKYMKRGLKLKRKGWNGKTQYIELASNISYKAPEGCIVNCEHEAIGNQAIAFVGTSGVQMGWLASQADMLAEDWMFAE